MSEAEIFSYFERENIEIKNHKLKSNGLLVEIDGNLDMKKMINEIGGTIAIGKVLLSGNKEEIFENIKNKPIYFGRDNKVVYSVLNYANNEEEFEEILEAMKKNFANERLKARYKGVSGTIKLQSGRIVHGSPEKILLRDMNYFVFSDEKEINFGFLEESYDSSEAEKRDMGKPYRREELAISPRLARILINLSQSKEKETLVDPFCGIGVILGEALLKEINVIGVDIDSSAVENARKNIEWLRQNYKIDSRAIIINKDSTNVRIDKADGIATEPPLGRLMTKIPNKEEACRIIEEFENLMIEVLNNVGKALKKGGKIAFSAPLIKTQKGRIGCYIEKICEKTGLKVHILKDVIFPIQEYREEQILGREIIVLAVD